MARRITRVERLARKEEKATVRRTVSLSIISIIIAVVLLTAGVSFLGKFADFLGLIFKKSDQTSTDPNAPQPPRIESIAEATNSARLAISGFSSDGSSVDIFLNGKTIGNADVVVGKFVFEDITLENGENKIEAKALNDAGKESDFSNSQTIVFDKDEPKLEIEGPTEGQFFFANNRIKVFGKTDKDAQVFANGFLASVNAEGNFEVFLSLSEGENNIEIKAVDTAGNTKAETRKVIFRK